MLKRFAALLFVIALAGQVWAGVCLCLKGGEDDAHAAMMSCCKREKADTTVMSAKSCCDRPCGESDGNELPRSASDTSFKIPAPVLSAVEKLIAPLRRSPNFAARLPISKRSGDAPLQLSHPPDLYLQNHAFLI